MDQFMSSVSPPPALVMSKDFPTNWKLWKEQWENYAIVVGVDDKDEKVKKAIFLNAIGTEAYKAFKNMDNPTIEGDLEVKKLSAVIRMFDIHAAAYTNVIYERYMFNQRSQLHDESVSTYITCLKELVITCNYPDLVRDDLIRDRIVQGISDNNLRKRLLREKGLTLAGTVDMCRGDEATQRQAKGIAGSTPDNPITINAVKQGRGGRTKQPHHGGRSQQPNPDRKPHPTSIQATQCKFCGRQHQMSKKYCPAVGAKCHKCGKLNHFSKCCHTKGRVNHVQIKEQGHSESDEEYVYNVSKRKNKQKGIFAAMKINGHQVKFQLDTGACVNVLPRYLLPRDASLTKSDETLRTYSGTLLQPLGKMCLTVTNCRNGEQYTLPFQVVDCNTTPLLGEGAVQLMKLLTVNDKNFCRLDAVTSSPPVPNTLAEVKRTYKTIFEDSLGNIGGTVQLKVKPDSQPVIQPARKIPVALEDKVRQSLKTLVTEGVLEPVDKPTSWVSQMAVAEKSSGAFRICLDPRSLNSVLMREHYELPTIDSMLHKLQGAKVFSKADLRNGFWHLTLDEESSDLTTMATPFGRYKWRRLPFGLNTSSEIFQKRILEVYDGLRNIIIIADDVLICGYGINIDEATKDHDKALQAFLQRSLDKNVRLNANKFIYKAEKMPFMGHVITGKGVLPDPDKVEAITRLEDPTDVSGVRRLCGCVNYMSKFIPHLADVAKPLHDLTKKDVAFKWEAHHSEAVEQLKQALSKAPLLSYFDNKAHTTVQCDASNRGLGAVILQHGRPVAYCSRAMTDTETRYAQLEKELLAVVFALKKFDQMTYGRHLTVVSDHKPLEIIFKKPLAKAPRRLQSMMLNLQRYSFDLKWQPGKEMHVADFLSRAYLSSNSSAPTHVKFEVNILEALSYKDEQLEKIKGHTDDDPVMQQLKDIILQGWPEKRENVRNELLPYWSFRDELCVTDGIIFKGSRLVIPASLRTYVKDKLHVGHRGSDAILRHARDIVYWPNMNEDIREQTLRCETCEKHATAQPPQPLHPHELTERPWEKVGVDLFTIKGMDYLATVDYLSNFVEVDRLYTSTSITVKRKLMAHFARYGVPDTLVSDNGPQFTSDEFKHFVKEWGINHVTSSPHLPRSNGMAESAVKTLKRTMIKCADDKTNVHEALLNLRNTPRPGLHLSPAQLLMSRRTRTIIPTSKSLLVPATPPDTKALRRQRQAKQAALYNKKARYLRPLEDGEQVRIQPMIMGTKIWNKGTIKKKVATRSYEVETNNGTVRRNRQHLKPTTSSFGRTLKPVQHYGAPIPQ